MISFQDDGPPVALPLKLIDIPPAETLFEVGMPLVVNSESSSVVPIGVANCFALTSADFSGVAVATCAESSSLCLSQHCDDSGAQIGFACFCDAAGAQQSATECVNHPQMEVLVPSSLELTYLLRKPESASEEMVLLNPSHTRPLEWHAKHKGGFWNASATQGNIAMNDQQVISVTAESANLQARAEPYLFNLTYTGLGLCACDDQRAITMKGVVYVSADLDTKRTTVTLDESKSMVAGSAIYFDVTPVSARPRATARQATRSHQRLPVCAAAGHRWTLLE